MSYHFCRRPSIQHLGGALTKKGGFINRKNRLLFAGFSRSISRVRQSDGSQSAVTPDALGRSYSM